MILAFMEQDNVLKATRQDLSSIDPRNWPPNWGTNPAVSTEVKSYICPSAPNRSIDYGPYFVSLGLPNAGVFKIGATDYSPIRGAHNNFRNACATTMPTPSNESGVLGVEGTMTAGSLTKGQARFADVTDGLSNTIVFGEAAGRHQVYVRGRPLTPNTPGQVGWTLNAAYMDVNSVIQVRGFSNDGVTPGGGCCVINCTNGRTSPFTQGQLYSFHPGGLNVLRTDGSVQYLRETVTPAILAAMITRAGGEVIPN
jgi:prepilin-type processing-associated H-X9-DG protein